jgi:cellulose synthase/poly-beta-1,6-N-acetylglucosamine synthase-like glycosyltransferase
MALIAAPLFLDLAIAIAGNICPARRRRAAAKRPIRLAAIVPAHNEEAMIARTVASLHAADALTPVLVVAHNCTDGTANQAAAAGAEVFELNDPAAHGKGAALRMGFALAAEMGFDAFLVVDADSVVSSNLIAATQAAMELGAQATQCRYELEVPPANSRNAAARLRALACRGMNVFRPAGRVGLGFSAGLFGNGFALTQETLNRVPFSADSIVEDLEYHMSLVSGGLRVDWVEDAFVRAPVGPPGMAQAVQDSRWAGGRLGVARRWTGRLVAAILRGRWRAIASLCEAWSLPLSYGLALLLLAALLPVPWLHAAAWGCAGIAALYIIGTIFLGDDPLRDFAALVAAPAHLGWKAAILPLVLRQSRRRAEWARTRREAPRP